MSKIHIKKTAIHECTMCNVKFKSKNQWASHISAVHEEIKPFKCETCAKSYAEKKALKNHITIQHL